VTDGPAIAPEGVEFSEAQAASVIVTADKASAVKRFINLSFGDGMNA
jgi:hypothetical protein